MKLLVEDEFQIVTVSGVKGLDYTDSMYDVLETTTNLCLYDLKLTHQCEEGNNTAPWRERTYEDLVEGVRYAKLTSAAEAFSYFSFNGPYFSRYMDSLVEASKYFSRVSSINIRLDILAASIKKYGDNNVVRLLKELGASSLSAPSEGWGQRMRSNFFNKNVSRDDFLTVAEEAIKLKYNRYKIGMIYSGYDNVS